MLADRRRDISMTTGRLLITTVAIAAAVAASPARVRAQANPEFKFEEKPKEEVKAVEWKATAQAGLIITTGNSQTTSMSGVAKGSRKAGANKLELEGGGAFARSTIRVASDDNMNGSIDDSEVVDITQTTNERWYGTARYDRFLTEHNSLYAKFLIESDEPAGKELVLGGQVGYSRQLYKDAIHELKAEGGYDYSHEDLVAGPGVSIHSLRAYVGYAGKLSEDTAFAAEVEGLFNLNPISYGVLADLRGAEDAGTFEDTRVNGATSLTTKMLENISFRFAFGFKWDNRPAPQPNIGGLPFTNPRESDELDTKIEASLILNFL
jgi:hypothetical protein